MNKSTRHLVVVQNKVLRLQAELLRLAEQGLHPVYLRARAEEILDLKASVNLK